ncbi:MAG: hypothetical protein ACOYBJ_02955 [Patescibacteria group bacterium]|jgi:pentose-5-phosphate-3-epimerase
MGVIVPAILAPTTQGLVQQAAAVAPLSTLVSYDVAEEQFVGTSTPGPLEYPKLTPDRSVIWHLMVHEPVLHLPDCLSYPTHSIVVHAEARGANEALAELRTGDVLGGLAINVETPVEQIFPFLPDVDFVQLMTVRPGGQGRPFEPAALTKIPELRAKRENLVIAIDGGVSPSTIATVARYRPDYVFVGSALTSVEDPADAYRVLTQALEAATSIREG